MRWIPLSVFLMVAAIAVWLSRPLPRTGLACDPHPVAGYDDAVRLVDSLRAAEAQGISSECGTRLMTHGAKTHRVIVMFHGLTNCPEQFDSLGRLSFARGANVLIPRLPHHGLANRMTGDLAHMSAPEMRAFTDRVMDAASGLGDSVTVAGLSIGGSIAAWVAQHRPGVDRAVMIAPMIGLSVARGRRSPVVARLMGAFPNSFMWWDPARKEKLAGPTYVYPRFATHSISAMLTMGWTTLEDAERHPPLCRSLAVITVGSDMAIDNGLCTTLVSEWRRHGVRDLVAFQFPKELKLNHDVVDPRQAGGNPSITYPVLTALIGP